VAPGIFRPGAENAITDVSGVRVGHATVIEGDSVRTGVTAVLPHGGNLFTERVPAAIHVGNGFGKLLGSTHRNLERLAARAMLGMARTGSSASNGSGDYVIAFSTAQSVRRRVSIGATDAGVTTRTVQDLDNDATSALFQAVIEATEEAIYNSLFMATPIASKVGKADPISLERVKEILSKYNVRR
jgi:L-aminopeptidase/D-esterase-like protein